MNKTSYQDKVTLPEVGEELTFSHRLTPDDELIHSVGTVLSIKKGKNDEVYICTNVGSHTQKYLFGVAK
ncbi:hypothetical protein [Bacillus sp. Marseille-P3800]|uniref:hypothetical protein n=1 Tax=Bacillus sp. Marseille-P3800 TaxID=2014782 RepID=UPI000C0841AE|nr:hypothetical protein [Bacillus sp. Marseille-P3800]